MTIRNQQKGGRRSQPATVVTRMSRRDCTTIKLRRKTPSSEIRPDIMKRDRTSTYLTTRSQTKTRRSTHRQAEVSKLVKTTKQKLDSSTVKLVNKSKSENIHKNLATKFTGKKIDIDQENETDDPKQAQYLSNEEETKPKCVQETNVSKEDITLETDKEQIVTRLGEGDTNQGNVDGPYLINSIPQTPRPTRGSKHDYAQLAGIKRRSPPSPELPRFARKARRHSDRARKRTRQVDAEDNLQNASCIHPTDVSEEHDRAEDMQSPKESQATCEKLVTRSKKRHRDNGEKSTTEQRLKIVKNPFLERDSQQKTRKRLLRNCSTSAEATETVFFVSPKENETDVVESPKVHETRARVVESPKAKDTIVVEESSETECETSCELDYYVDEAETSPEFVKYFHETRRPPKPEPDVYNWPKEWLPKPDTPLVPADTSALEIDPQVIKPPRHVFENTFYLQSPPKMRSEMERWKFNFDYSPEVETARLKKIKETESQLLSETVTGRRRTKMEKLAIKQEAKRIVDTEEYLEKLARYKDRKERDMEIMRGVYKERDLGEPLDTDNIAKMAMDIKRRVYLKSMKISYPDHILVEENETDNGNVDLDFTVPKVDTITNEAKTGTNQILQESETSLERNLGAVFHEAETRPALGVNYIYESYKMERNRKLDHSYSDNHELHAEGVGGEMAESKPRGAVSEPTKRMTLWFGHDKHRKTEQYKKQKYSEVMADCSSNSYGSNYDAKETQKCKPSASYYENEAMVMPSKYSEREEPDDEEERNYEAEGEEFEEEAISQSRLTLWYGHSNSNADDEDEAIKLMCGGSQMMKFDDDCDKEEMTEGFYNTKSHSTLWYGHDEVTKSGEDDSIGRGTKRKFEELETEDDEEMVDDEDEGDEELTFTRTVPFLHLTTEDLPLRVQTQTYKFKRMSRDAKSPDVQIDR
ncbi:uncharacterized protein LOC110440320 [Mizuhopecten yessoensis]|nr:uncharacterized protein LOC110440320 [Mizuhopecten yessoensis]